MHSPAISIVNESREFTFMEIINGAFPLPVAIDRPGVDIASDRIMSRNGARCDWGRALICVNR
jgi:hypothetical protein